MKKILGLVTFLAITAIIGCQSATPEIAAEDRVFSCTDEAKICSDGTAVSRGGELCEFAACPDELSVGE